MFAVMLQGVLRDGIQNWTSSFIVENFSVKTSASILTSTLLPLLSMFSVAFALAILKLAKCPLKTALLLYGITLIFASITFAFRNFDGLIFIVVLTAIITACAYGINTMLTNTGAIVFCRIWRSINFCRFEKCFYLCWNGNG